MCGDEFILFVVPEDNFSTEKCSNQLAKTLASYMMPDRIVKIEKIPLTANGKTDMRALMKASEESTDDTAKNTDYTELEKKICIIWGNVLNRSNIPIDRTFFETGGSSMKLLILQKELEKYFGRDIPVTELFTYPTIRKFAGFIGGTASDEKAMKRNNAWNESKERRRCANVFIKRTGSKI